MFLYKFKASSSKAQQYNRQVLKGGEAGGGGGDKYWLKLIESLRVKL